VLLRLHMLLLLLLLLLWHRGTAVKPLPSGKHWHI
jgi:hypothetical protein